MYIYRSTDEEFLMMNSEEIPKARFNPTDEEIITYYLRPKVEGEDMTRFSPVISEQDLYNELPPWVIFQAGGVEDVHMGRFFYTRLKKKHDSGEKIHRTVGKKGEYCWDAQDNGNNIYDHRTMTVIGKRKQYSLIRSNQKKDGGANKKRKQISSSKDDDEHNEIHESFGHWIMHEYTLVNPSSISSKNNQNYALCRIMMKAPPKPTTTIGNAAIHDHATPAPSTANDFQNISYPQQQDYRPGLAHAYYDQQNEELQQLVMLLHDQEQPAPMEEWLAPAPVVSEWKGYGLDDIGDNGTSSSSSYNDQHKISDDTEINHDQILLVDLTKNMEPLPPIILPKSTVQQEQYNSKNKDIPSLFSNMSTRMQEEERRVMINIVEGIKSDDLDSSTAIVDRSIVSRSIAPKKNVGKSNPKPKLF